MSAKRDRMVRGFVGHVADDPEAESVIDALEPVKLPELAKLFRTKLTPDIVREMGLKVAAGTPIPVAASELGIQKHTWAHWAQYAKADQLAGKTPGWGEGESPYLVWAGYMQQAKAQLEGALIRGIVTHGGEDWKALAWVAERRFPDRWALKKQVEHSVKNDVSKLSTEQLIDLAEKKDEE